MHLDPAASDDVYAEYWLVQRAPWRFLDHLPSVSHEEEEGSLE